MPETGPDESVKGWRHSIASRVFGIGTEGAFRRHEDSIAPADAATKHISDGEDHGDLKYAQAEGVSHRQVA